MLNEEAKYKGIQVETQKLDTAVIPPSRGQRLNSG